jgi:hypothetical protein
VFQYLYVDERSNQTISTSTVVACFSAIRFVLRSNRTLLWWTSYEQITRFKAAERRGGPLHLLGMNTHIQDGLISSRHGVTTIASEDRS